MKNYIESRKDGVIVNMNSSLVQYIQKSPNTSGLRSNTISRITPHCVVGQLSVESLGSWFEKASTNASSNYGIGSDGRIALYVDETDRAWTSSSADNDNRAVTIECASDSHSPYAMNDKVYSSLINLCVDICRRHNKDRLIWIPDKSKALSYQPKDDELLLTVHRWFSPTECPGDWLYSRLSDLASRVTLELSDNSSNIPTISPSPKTAPTNSQTTLETPLTPEAFIQNILKTCQEEQRDRGILASVQLAQACLESDYGRSELATKAMNIYGMKSIISGNSWDGSVWNGLPYMKRTKEYDNGEAYAVNALFRRYDDWTQSIHDHGAYLANAMNGTKKRYDGITTESDPRKACEIIATGGYATDPKYADKLLDIINRYSLTQYDGASDVPAPPFDITIDIDDLNLRAGAGLSYNSKGFIQRGKYSITKVRNKDGYTWGKIKPVSGWVCLDYVDVI